MSNITELLSKIFVDIFLTPCGRDKTIASSIASKLSNSFDKSPEPFVIFEVSSKLHDFEWTFHITKPLEVEPKRVLSSESNFN